MREAVVEDAVVAGRGAEVVRRRQRWQMEMKRGWAVRLGGCFLSFFSDGDGGGGGAGMTRFPWTQKKQWSGTEVVGNCTRHCGAFTATSNGYDLLRAYGVITPLGGLAMPFPEL
ncbi:hypothetical protein Tco_1155613 [Tanacetum coccineum]